MQSLRHGLQHLTDFSGRDSSALFWPYALSVFCGVVGVWFASFFAVMMRGTMEMARFAEQHPDKVDVVREGGRTSYQLKEAVPGLGPDPMLLLGLCVVLGVAVASLLAASVTRRLHDTGRSGWFAALPAGLLFSGLGVLFAVFSGAGFGWFALGFVNNGLYMLSLLVLLVFLIGRSAPEPNAYGAPQG